MNQCNATRLPVVSNSIEFANKNDIFWLVAIIRFDTRDDGNKPKHVLVGKLN
jgi:hypothetical protein